MHMGMLSPILCNMRGPEGDYLMFWCPGCDEAHQITIRADKGPVWAWPGKSVTKPTFTPSLMVQGHRMSERGLAEFQAWEKAGRPSRLSPFDMRETLCHSFITDGKIQFLMDCSHSLKGQTVDIPIWPLDRFQD